MTFWFIYFDVLLWVTRISYVWPIIPDLWHTGLWGSWSPKPWNRFSYSNKADIQLPSLKQTGQPSRNLGDGSIRFWANPVCFVFRDIIRDWEHSSLGTKDSSSFWLKLADKALPLLLPWNSTNIIVKGFSFNGQKQKDAEEFDSSMIVEAGKKVDEWEMT